MAALIGKQRNLIGGRHSEGPPMLDQYDYAGYLQRAWRLSPRTISVGRSETAMFAAARLTYDFAGHGHVLTQDPKGAYDLYVWFRDLPAPPHWLGGRAVKAPVPVFRSGVACVSDVSIESEAMFMDPFDGLHIRIGHDAVNDLADETGVPRVPMLLGTGAPDPILASLAHALAPAIDAPHAASPFYLEHLALAITAHVAVQYGGMQERPEPRLRGLSSMQLRRVTELMADRVCGNLTLATLATACGMSRSHFASAFKQSTGMSPHRWWVHHRLSQAKDLLAGTQLPISTIASMCGFFDQSHLTNTFRRVFSVTPCQYRRVNR